MDQDNEDDKLVTLNLPLRYFQERTIKNCIKIGRGTIVIGTGGGKTLLMACLVQTVRNGSKNTSALIIAH